MAEGARLESVFTGNRNVGSNPTPSASANSLVHPDDEVRRELWHFRFRPYQDLERGIALTLRPSAFEQKVAGEFIDPLNRS